jgi:membrane protease YdiL (CAAX protease family)
MVHPESAMGRRDEWGSVRDIALPDRCRGQSEGCSASDGLVTFVALAWGTTWLLSLPLIANSLGGLPPQPYMLALAGLSAFGPSFGAFVVARRQRRLRDVFMILRTNPLWLAVGLLTAPCLHLIARLLEFALGGDVTRWFWLPQNGAQVAALVVFSLGEEFGWRGFAHPRLRARCGPVLGPLVTGLIWGIWHLPYGIVPPGGFELSGFALMLIEFMAWGLVIAWLFERAQRSMAVAISIHAGGHLDNSAQIAGEDWRLRAFTLLVLGVAALLAARSLGAAPAGEPVRT